MNLKIPILETKRLILRKFRLADAKDLVGLGYKTRRFKIDSLKKAKLWIKKVSKPKDGFDLGIFLKENGKLIGHLELCHMNWWYKAGEIGYTIHKDYRGKGYAIEASTALIDYCFKKMKLRKIYADTDPDNIISQKVLAKLGFKLEGRIREKNFVKGKWVDELDYGLLKREWKRR